MKNFKLWVAALLRKWAQRLDGVGYLPATKHIRYETHELVRYRLDRAIPLDRIERLRYRTQDEARVREILKQETIVEAAVDLAKMLEVFELAPFELRIRGEFYLKPNADIQY